MLHNDPDGSLVEELFDHAPTPTTEQHLLSEPIAALCLPPPITVSPGTSIREAVRVMVDAHIGAVPIVEDGRLLGIFTERDVLCRVTL